VRCADAFAAVHFWPSSPRWLFCPQALKQSIKDQVGAAESTGGVDSGDSSMAESAGGDEGGVLHASGDGNGAAQALAAAFAQRLRGALRRCRRSAAPRAPHRAMRATRAAARALQRRWDARAPI
jgi:hypothetical protein